MSEADGGKGFPFPGGAPPDRGSSPPDPVQQDQRRRIGRIIEQMNERLSVANDHGAVWIFEQVQDKLRPGYRTVYRMTAPHFRLLFQNQELALHEPKPTAKDPKATKLVVRKVADLWLNHPKRRTYRDVVFAPGQTKLPHGVFNLFQGLAVIPARPRGRGGPSWERLKHHIRYVICRDNDAWYDYLMDWLAHMLQYPAQVGETAVVLQGGEGVGKGILARYLLKIVGPYGLHLSNAQQLHGRYNLHLQNCIFLFSDEAYYPGDKSFEGMLRAMITEERLPVEPKFQNLFETINCLHFLISSNNQWVVPMATDARRFFVLRVLDLHPRDDTDYWDPLWYELDHGGPEAMLGELLDRNISHFNVRDVPDTPEGRVQKRYSLSTVKKYWMAALEREYPYRPAYNVPSVRQWHPFWPTQWIWKGLQQWCDDQKIYSRPNETDLGQMLTELYGGSKRPREWHPFDVNDRVLPGRGHQPESHQDWLRFNDEREEPTVPPDRLPDDPLGYVVMGHQKRGYHVGPIDAAREAFDRVYGPIDTPWQHDTDDED
ncbi:MAG TPA: primase-helicase family protein [Stellaceae bacterium]|jgi:hypothetical protein